MKSAAPDPAKEAWYVQSAAQVAVMNRQAESFFQSGKQDEAAALIEQAQPMLKRLLTAAKPLA